MTTTASSSPAGLKHYVHINRHIILSNKKHGEALSALVSRRGRSGKAVMGKTIEICDAHDNVVARLVQRPDHPLPCGATCYLECDYKTEVIEED